MVNLTKLVQVRLAVLCLILGVYCSSSSALSFDGSYKISPKPCTVDERTGTCMFVWECLKTEGKHLGMCVDGFMFGSCCGHNTSSNFVLDHNSIASSSSTNVPQETAIFQTISTSRPQVVSATTFTTTSATTTTTSTTTTTDRLTAPTTTRPVVSTKRPVTDSYGSLSNNGELKLPFITANGSYFPEQHTLSSSTIASLSSTQISSNSGSSSSSYLHGSSSFFSKPTPHPPTFTTSTSTTTTSSTTARPTTTTTFTTTRSTSRTTERPTTIFIDPKSTTTPQTNIPMDRDYGCGVPPLLPQMRIVGGKNASFAEFPWQVSVRRTSFFGFSSTHRCGGALLNENWIATAGHCVDDLLTSQIRVRLGEWDFSGSSEKYPHVERGVVKKVVHPSYNFFTYEHDLALIKLESPVILSPHIIPICLPGNDDLLINENATVSGWGRLSEGGQLPNFLQHVTVPILSNSKCREMFKKSGRQEHIPDIFVCAGYEHGGKDSCQGDSGGPLQVRGSDNRWFLAGIISWGIGCAEPNMPGVCTRISKFTSWILKHVTA